MSYRSTAHSSSPIAWLKRLSPINILLVVILGIGLLAGLYAAKVSQENRQQASVSGGTAILSFDAPATAAPGTKVSIPLKVNTGISQVIGVQAFVNVTGAVPSDLTFTPATVNNLNLAVNSLQDITGGKKLTLGLLTSNPSVSYSTQNTQITLGTLSFTAGSTGVVTLAFDPATTKIVQASTNQDILKTPDTYSVTFEATKVVETSPTPTATAIAQTTPTPGTGGFVPRQCNESCGSNSECAVNLRCYNGQCRKSTNVDSNTCSDPTDQGIHRTCNEYCSDNSECAGGYSCFYNRCRRPDNPDSVSCSVPSATTTQQINLSCGQACSSNSQCAANLRCYTGVCRLATNPTSRTCSAPVITTTTGTTIITPVASITPDKGTEMPADFASPIPSPSSTSDFGLVSPRPTTSTQPITPVEMKKTGLAGFLQSLKERGISLPTLALLLGLVIFLIVIGVLVVNYQRGADNSQPPGVVTSTPPPSAIYEQSLEQKINALRGSANTPVAQNTMPMASQTPVTGPELPVARPTLEVTPLAPATPPQPMSYAQPTPVAQYQPTPVSPEPPLTQPRPSMVDRLAQRGVSPSNPIAVPPTDQPKI